MISLTNKVSVNKDTVEGIKLFEIFNCYRDIAMFWNQENTDICISLLDGNMIISGENADFEELKSFVNVISPSSIFSSEKVLSGLGLFNNSEVVRVLKAMPNIKGNFESDKLSSDDVYNVLRGSGLSMPPFENFATDYCLRLNKGRLKVFGIKEKAVALTIGTDNILIHALASNEKGLGSYCLKGILTGIDNTKVFVCATDMVKGFYEKNGFKEIYSAGYWRK